MFLASVAYCEEKKSQSELMLQASSEAADKYELFVDGKLLLYKSGWSSKQAINHLLNFSKKYPDKKVKARYDGEYILTEGTGYELYWKGKRVGHEPDWKLSQSERNLRWNIEHHPDIEVVGLYGGRLLATPSHMVLLPAWKRHTASLDQKYQIQEFRLFYTFKGKHALPLDKRKDADNNKIPDYIEDIGLQLVSAKYIYTNVLKLRHPFEGNRYKGRVKYFDVSVAATPLGKPERPGAALAGSGVVNYYRESDPLEGVNVLTIDLSNKSLAHLLNPAHELFHEFQYGYTMFKNKWFLEGMARYSESLFNQIVPPTMPLPRNSTDRDKLFEMGYDGCRFWQTILQAVDQTGTFQIPPEIANARYKTSGKSIIQDNQFAGAVYIKSFLEELDKMDDMVSDIRNLDPNDWPDSVQHSPENNPYVWKAVLEACRKISGNNNTLRSFVQQFREGN